jgi:WD40 repeat protein
MFAATWLRSLGADRALGLGRRWLQKGHLVPAGLVGLALLAALGILAFEQSQRNPPSVPPVTTLRGHRYSVQAVAFSPDGRTLATAAGLLGHGGEVKLWDVATWRAGGVNPPVRVTLSGHTDAVYAVAFSPDSGTLATGGADGTGRLWDVASGRERTRWPKRGRVLAVAFAPDGRTLASAPAGGPVLVWDVLTGQERLILEGCYPAVAFAPDGQTLATGSPDGGVQLWDLATGQPRAVLGERGQWVHCVAFACDSQTLAVAYHGATVEAAVALWDLARQQVRRTLAGHPDLVVGMAFAPGGRTLATASRDRSVKLWDVATGRERATLRSHTGVVTGVAFSPDGRWLATASTDRTVRLWPLAGIEEGDSLPRY